MFLRSTKREKDGKVHRYFSVVENRRLAAGGTAQRTVLYLGEINDKQEESWRKSLTVFDQDHAQYTTMSLFPDDHAALVNKVVFEGRLIESPRNEIGTWH